MPATDPKVINRQKLERKIVRAVVKAIINAGYTVLIDNGGDYGEEVAANTVSKAMKEVMQTDEDRIFVVENGKRTGRWVYFVYGNDGWDVICDYTVSCECFMTEADKIAEAAQR